jgi:hypothetical protein
VGFFVFRKDFERFQQFSESQRKPPLNRR